MRRRPNSAKVAAGAVALALLAAAPSQAANTTPAANPGEALLRRADVADDKTSYAGTISTVVYGPNGAQSTVVRVDHLAPDKWRLWYVAPADAYGRLILSNETLTYQYEPKTATIYSDAWSQSSPGVSIDLDTAKVLKNYIVSAGAQSDIAGRKATALSLTSRFTGSLAERIWIDTQTALVLQREVYHADGTIDTKTGFDEVRMTNDFPKQLFDLSVPSGMHVVQGATFGKSAPDPSSFEKSLGFQVISPSYLPDGFTLDKAALSDEGGIQSVQLVYTDGLRDFSVFENSTRQVPDLPNPIDLVVGDNDGVTATIAGETLLSWNTDGLNVTMVGDLAARELAKIGASVKP